MNVTVNRNRLAALLSQAAKACGGVGGAAWEKHLLLQVRDGRIEATGCNGETFLRSSEPTEEVRRGGELLVAAQSFSRLVGAMESESVELRMDDGRLFISDAFSRHTLPTLEASNYPAMPVVPEDAPHARWSMDPESFRRSVALGSSAASAAASDGIYCGCWLALKGSMVLWQSTERGNRTASAASDAADTVLAKSESRDVSLACVDAERLRAVAALTGDDPVDVRMNAHQVQFDFGYTTLITRLIEGKAPPFERLTSIRERGEFSYVVSTEQALRALRRISITANAKKEEFIKVAFQPRDGHLILHATTGSDARRAVENLPCKEFAEGGRLFGVNHRYLVEALSVLGTETAKITLSEEIPMKVGGQEAGRMSAIIVEADEEPTFCTLISQIVINPVEMGVVE